MRKTKKIVMTAGALLVLSSASGCDIPKMEAYFAPDRRLPDGSTTTFDNVHSPELNPTGNDPTRHAPSQETNGSMNDSTFQKVPVVPVAATTMDNANSYPALASVPQKPDVPPSAELGGNMNSLIAQQKTSDTARANLMSDPNVTVMTSPQTGQLVANAADAMPPAAPATPSTAQPPATLIADATQPAAQNTAAPAAAPDTSDKSFGSWLHNLFSSDSKPADSASANAPAQMARQTPVENTAAVAADTSQPSVAGGVTTTGGAPILRAPSQVVAQVQPEEAPGLDSPPSTLTQPAPQAGQVAAYAAPAPAAVASIAPAPAISGANTENNFPLSHGDVPPAPQAALQPTNPEPQNAAPQQAAANGSDGFGSWMNEVFGSKKEAAGNAAPAPAPVETQQVPAAADVSTAAAPAVPVAVQQAPVTADVSATATPAAPVVDTASVGNVPPSPVPAPVAQESALPSTANLQSPNAGAPAITSQPLPDVSQLASQNSAPINLVQPSESQDYSNYSSNGYIGDSRYAGRVHTDN